ncbi:divalent-cation tolerance protein CutA [Sphingomonas sp. PR090111-T3T-6A]|uniref:divalent-cation tolerance protein CutA n=1 Tax=Sphingomonas sp. PR090111-T3T-6A TaxID=685778 RepID=UPI0003AA9DC9|nr:divalent-cation tolerance protein CutA [Sphingomonas sp. PR090111-T3T-6A]
MTECVVITTSVAGREDAHRIAGALIGERLAACVQIMPIESHYRWEGEVEQASELLLTIKTSAERTLAVQARILALHSYAVPEVLVTPVIGGAAAYLDWIAQQVRPAA